MKDRRFYQGVAIRSVKRLYGRGSRSVLLVGPAGAGKTYMGSRIAEGDRVLWIAHRRELVWQAAATLAEIVGEQNVGIIMSGELSRPHARVQVASMGTLLERQVSLTVDLIVLDEAHHYEAQRWKEVVSLHHAERTLGLTATPERFDGRPLGDTFDSFVVAATYRHLSDIGVLAPWQVIRPDREIGHHLAMDVVEAWRRFSGAQQTILFEPSVDVAKIDAERFRRLGVRAECIDFETPKIDRDAIMDEYRAGRVKILTCVYTLGEGVDIPEASVIMLARNIGYVGTYIQLCGRGARAARDKVCAVLVDLCGCSHRHKFPDVERNYSLEGQPIVPTMELDRDGFRQYEQRVLDHPMAVAPGSFTTKLPDPVEGMYERRHADKVHQKLRKISRRSGRRLAEMMSTYYGGMTE